MTKNSPRTLVVALAGLMALGTGMAADAQARPKPCGQSYLPRIYFASPEGLGMSVDKLACPIEGGCWLVGDNMARGGVLAVICLTPQEEARAIERGRK